MSKRLLSMNNYFYLKGGAEKVFFDHNSLMEKSGWDVAPFAMHSSKNEASEWDAYFVDEIEFGGHQSFFQKVIDAGKIIHSLEARSKIGRLVDAFRPDIAHGHNIYHHISTSILYELRRREIPVVLTLHDLKIACPAYTMLSNGSVCERCKGGKYHVVTNRCMKGSFLLSGLIFAESIFTKLFGVYENNVAQYVVPSQFYIDKFVEWGFPREQFVHIPNFVDIEESVRPVGAHGNYYVYAGRLSREKGLITLIDAFSRVSEKLVVAGTGPEELKLKKMAENAGANNIVFTGYLAKEALASLVAGSRAVIVPSEWYENCPMSVIEAFAQGKPVVVADIGGLSEMITDGVDGFKFEAGAVDGLIAAVEKVMALNEAALGEMGHNAMVKAKTTYSREQYLEKTLKVYGHLNR